MKKFTPITILLVIAVLLAACGGANEVANNNIADNNTEVNNAAVVEENTEDMQEEEMAEEDMAEEALPSIAEIAAGDETFSTLVTALSAAGLVDTLAGEGEFTVFAPTNDAFDALGETLDAVLADEELLTRVLLYHVVSGVVPAETALTLDGQMVETLSGDMFSVSLQDGDLYIDNAKVIMTDIEASNGIIHVIDAVIVPSDDDMAEEALPSIAEIAAGDETFSTLVTALSAAGLVDTLAGEGEFTVFAPTNDAFDALGETLDAVLADEELLTRVLLYHVVSGVVPAETALTLDGQMVETLSGDKFSVSLQDGDLYIDNAKVIMTDIEASNGIIHVIDAVIVPSDDDMAEEALPSIAEIAAGDEDFLHAGNRSECCRAGRYAGR